MSVVKQCCGKTIAIPFLDHLISDVSSRFTTYSKTTASLQALLLINIIPATSCASLQVAINFYTDDLPNPDIFDEKISHCVMIASHPS